jgi:hypothetical protein
LVRNDDSDNYVGDSVSCWEKLSEKLVSHFGGWRKISMESLILAQDERWRRA